MMKTMSTLVNISGTLDLFMESGMLQDGLVGVVYICIEILKCEGQVDHISRDGLDNRKCNLRKATHTQNQINSISNRGTSKYKGVSWDKSRSKWVGKLGNGPDHFLGRFDSEEDAARAYDRAVIQKYGEFARPNFPEVIS
jgi:hypothetical protein